MSEPVVTATVVNRRRQRIIIATPRQWLYAILAVCFVVVIFVASFFKPSQTRQTDEPKITADQRELAANMVAGYQANGVISDVSPRQAYVSREWYELEHKNKERVAWCLIVHYDPASYKFLDKHSGKVVAEYDPLWGFRVK